MRPGWILLATVNDDRAPAETTLTYYEDRSMPLRDYFVSLARHIIATTEERTINRTAYDARDADRFERAAPGFLAPKSLPRSELPGDNWQHVRLNLMARNDETPGYPYFAASFVTRDGETIAQQGPLLMGGTFPGAVADGSPLPAPATLPEQLRDDWRMFAHIADQRWTELLASGQVRLTPGQGPGPPAHGFRR